MLGLIQLILAAIFGAAAYKLIDIAMKEGMESVIWLSVFFVVFALLIFTIFVQL